MHVCRADPLNERDLREESTPQRTLRPVIAFDWGRFPGHISLGLL